MQKTNGELEVYDVMGKVVLREYIAPWSQFKKVDISRFSNGIYLCKLRWGNILAIVKVVKE